MPISVPSPTMPPPTPIFSGSNAVTAPRTSSSAPSISPTGASVPARTRPEAPRSCSRSTSSSTSRSSTMKRLLLTSAVVSIVAMPSPISAPPLAVLSSNAATAMRALGPS